MASEDFSVKTKVTADVSNFEKGIKTAQSSLSSFSKGITSVTKSLMGLFAIQNFGSFIKSIGNIATSFDDARSQIVKGTGATGQALEDLSNSVSNAMRMGVGKSAEEIGSMIVDLNTRFGATGEVLENLVDDFDMFAGVTGQDTKTAIESVADVMLKWNIETEQADDLLDQLTVASQASGASVEELESGLKIGQTTFKQFGMSVTKSTAFLASLKKNGIDSGTALAGLRVALVNFTKEGRNAETAFKEVTEQIKNASTESEALNIAIDTFGSKMGAELVKVFREGGESVDEMTKALMGAKGALKESDEASRTTKDALEELKAVFTSLFAGMNGTGVRDVIDNISESLKSLDISSIKNAIGNFTNEIKTLALNVGTIIKTIYDNFKILFTRIVELLGQSTLTFDDWKESIYETLDTLYRIIQDAFGVIFAILDGDWALAWEYAKLVVLRTVEQVIENLDKMTSQFKDKIQQILTVAQIASSFLPNVVKAPLNTALTTIKKITANTDKERTALENAISATEANIESMTGKSADVQLKALERIGKKREKYVRDFEAGEIDIQSAVTDTANTTDDTSSVISEWDKKLLKQRLDDLDEWTDSYRDTQVKILEAERESELKHEHSAEEIAKINQYYDKEIEKAHEKSEEAKRNHVAETVKKITDNLKNIATKAVKIFKDVLSGIKNVFNKALDIFKFNPDDALNSLLAIEDAILTFFVETLPKLPQFFSSAIQSIVILLDTLLDSIDWEKVQSILNSIIDTIIENAPKIINQLLDLVINIAQTLLNGLIHFVENGGWKMMLDTLLTIQKRLEQFVIDNIDEIVQTIIDMLPDLIQYLTDSIVSASKTLKKLLKPLIKLTMAFIEAIFEVLLSDEVLEASLEVIVELLGAIAEELIPRLAYLIPKLIVKIIGFIVKNLAKIVGAIVEGLIQGFAKINWFEVIKECFMGFIDGFKDLFGIHSPSKLFEEFGGYIVEGLWNGIKDLAGWLWNNLKSFFETMFANLKNLISSAWNGLKSAFGNMGSWFQEVFGNVGNVFSNIGSGIQSAFSGLQSFFSNLFSNIGSGIQGFISSAWSSISSFASSVGSTISGVMSSLWSSVSSTVSSVANQLYSGIQSAISRVRDAISSVGRGIRDFFGFANGTNDAPKGLALVGEQGPELIRFNGGEQVLNTRNTQKALEGAGGNTNNFNVTFNNLQDTSAFAMMNQLKQYNRQMAINGVI